MAGKKVRLVVEIGPKEAGDVGGGELREPLAEAVLVDFTKDSSCFFGAG
jgi:hypothetical protein